VNDSKPEKVRGINSRAKKKEEVVIANLIPRMTSNQDNYAPRLKIQALQNALLQNYCIFIQNEPVLFLC